MKKILLLVLCLGLLCGCAAQGGTQDDGATAIVLGETIEVNGEAIGEDAAAPVYLSYVVETHEDVPAELADVENRVVNITASGTYRLSGVGEDVHVAVKAGEEGTVRLILDGVDISCRTNAAIACYSAKDTRTPGEYNMIIELAEGSENYVVGSHNSSETEEFDGAVSSLVSMGFEGTGSLKVLADNEGVEVSGGHMTINGGKFCIEAGDDPLNVSEDGVGVLTMNDGYVYSFVSPAEGGEGDGIDSNGWIVFNGGTAINLAHPTSMDGGIDSDMGSSVNGGTVVGAGNMYDPIEPDSEQLFMMLEFAAETDDLVVVTDEDGNAVFAYDFPYSYTYIAFSFPELAEGTYKVFLGGEIEGTQENGLYTEITSYVPGTPMQHGAGTVSGEMGGPSFGPPSGEPTEEPAEGEEPVEGEEIAEAVIVTGDEIPEELLEELAGDGEVIVVEASGEMPMPMPSGDMPDRTLNSSADEATVLFVLTKDTTAFTNISAAE